MTGLNGTLGDFIAKSLTPKNRPDSGTKRDSLLKGGPGKSRRLGTPSSFILAEASAVAAGAGEWSTGAR